MTDLEKSEHKNASSTALSNKGAVPEIEKLRDIRRIYHDRHTIKIIGKRD